MKCQILFSRKNKKKYNCGDNLHEVSILFSRKNKKNIISLPSAESAHSVVNVK